MTNTTKQINEDLRRAEKLQAEASNLISKVLRNLKKREGKTSSSYLMQNIIKFDLYGLESCFLTNNKKDFLYHFKLLKGNLKDIGAIR